MSGGGGALLLVLLEGDGDVAVEVLDGHVLGGGRVDGRGRSLPAGAVAVEQSLEAAPEVAGEEAVDEGVHAAVGQLQPVRHWNVDLQWKEAVR